MPRNEMRVASHLLYQRAIGDSPGRFPTNSTREDEMKAVACDICGKSGMLVQTFKRSCDGDGSPGHHHGMVHTLLRGRTNDLARVGVECGCAEKDRAAWAQQ